MAAGRKTVVFTRLAQRDVDDAFAHYLDEAGTDTALRYADALEEASRVIARQPGMGSPRHAHALNLPGLRSWPLTGFPYLLFYFERSDALDIVRVLHMARDMPAWLATPD